MTAEASILPRRTSRASIPLLSTHFRIFIAFVSTCFIPMVLRFVYDGTPQGVGLAAVVLVISGTTLMTGRSFRATSDKNIELKVRTEHLAEQLQREKAAAEEARAAAEQARSVAEQARQAAETANRGKTQFFSAASQRFSLGQRHLAGEGPARAEADAAAFEMVLDQPEELGRSMLDDLDRQIFSWRLIFLRSVLFGWNG